MIEALGLADKRYLPRAFNLSHYRDTGIMLKPHRVAHRTSQTNEPLPAFLADSQALITSPNHRGRRFSPKLLVKWETQPTQAFRFIEHKIGFGSQDAFGRVVLKALTNKQVNK